MQCLNRKVLTGAGVLLLGVLVFAPQAFGVALPLVAMALCPLGMLLMMRSMSGGNRSCQNGAPAQPSTVTEADAEIIRLQVEIDRLRAEQDSQRAVEPSPPLQPTRP